MKLIIFLMIAVFGMSACSTKKNSLSEYEYQRANAASEKALEKLDRE